MKLVNFDRDGSAELGVVLGDGLILDVRSSQESQAVRAKMNGNISGGIVEILADDGLDAVRGLRDVVEGLSGNDKEMLRSKGAILDPDNIKYFAAIPNPGFILAQGLAYKKHLTEMGVPLPKTPVALVKTPSSVTGTGCPIILPADYPDMVDWEGEFSLVIGKECHNVSENEAMQYVAGYTIINDVSARDWTARALDPNQTPMQSVVTWGDNIHGKQFPTFTPMGPCFVTASEIPDPHSLDLQTCVNGEVMQETNTNDLIFPIAQAISHFSKWYRFRPGDVITTGSPAGVGYGRDPKIFLKKGDVVEVSVSKIGTLTNTVINATDAS